MMEQFIIKLEWEPSFDKMTDEQRGIMIKVFFDYHNGRELDFKGDVLVEALWLNMEPNIQRMNNKYMASVENGKKGGRPRKKTNNLPKPNNNLLKPNNNLPKPNNNLTDTLKEKEKEKEKVKEKVKEKEEVKENAMHAVTSNAMQIMEFSSLDFGKLNHKQKYEYLKLLKSGNPIIVEGERITIKDFCLIQEIPYDDEEYELDKEMSSIFN